MYIVFDLEWNQSARGKADSVEDFPFEIIEIGAVKLNDSFVQVDEFHRLIRPQVYKQLHYAISEVTHMSMDELNERGQNFEDAVREFLEWGGTGEDVKYCTWGPMDLTELQRNMRYFHVENPFPKPLMYYDVQKLYGLMYRDADRVSLDTAVHELELETDRPFHRAPDDAYYTGCVLTKMAQEQPPEKLLPYLSIDYFRLPENRREEISMEFPGYFKYVSQVFDSKETAMKDRVVVEMRCYHCLRALRKKIRWFSPNQKIYYALAICPEHGYMKGKIRLKHVSEQEVFAIKTLKLTNDAGADEIRQRKEDVRRRRSERNKAKKIRLKEQQEERQAEKKTKYRWKNKNNKDK
jgi:inhibitor of KinA sporulation pathway (predicted exonuclease)